MAAVLVEGLHVACPPHTVVHKSCVVPCIFGMHSLSACSNQPEQRQQQRQHQQQQYRGSLQGRWVAVAGVTVASAAWRHRGRRQKNCRCSSCVPRRFAAGESENESKNAEVPPSDQSFGFDDMLRQRFFEIAEPYFVPTEASGGSDSGTGGFGGLLFSLLLGVSSATFFLFLGFLSLASAVPALGALIPAPGPAAQLAQFASPPLLAAATVAFSTACLAFAWRREDLDGRWGQWGLLGLLIFLLLGVTGINVFVSYVFRSIENLLVAKNEAGFFQQLQLFIEVLVVAVPVIASYRYVRLTLARRWREFLTTLIVDKYFINRAYYMLDSNSTNTNIDNPDQRISEDVESFTSETLGFLLDILGSVLNLISFSAILWATSEQLTYALIAYALVGTVIALAVGGELIGINYKQLRLQADFRYSLVHVRDNAEAIAFYQGEDREKGGVVTRLQAALQNFDSVIKWTTGLTLYQKAFFYIARLVPYFVVGGLYFAGKVDFGTLGQVSFAFSMVLSSVTLIVSRIQDISRFSAGVNRLGAFYEALIDGERALPQMQGASDQITTDTTGFSKQEAHDGQVQLDNMTLWTPTGRMLIEDVSLELAAPATPALPTSELQLPSRLLIVGSSGVGKSSLLRAIAGLWTQGRGRIRRPDIGEMLFLPQKPYMPLGNLRLQLLYPFDEDDSHHNTKASVSDEDLVAVLARFGLGDLPERFKKGFSATEDWTRVLSLGEQQRLAAARCLLAEPKVAVLDEATSALPVLDEGNLYRCLQGQGISYVSVGHRPSLVEYHDLILELLGNGSWRLLSPREYEASLANAPTATAQP